MNQGTFKTFQDLEVWQAAREVRRKCYAVAKRLPDCERFNLASQMRRAALSVTNNIAEGHGRYHYQENIQFLRQSRGSLEELLNDLTLCTDEQYLPGTEIKALEQDLARVRALLNAYVRYLKERKQAVAGMVQEPVGAYMAEEDED